MIKNQMTRFALALIFFGSLIGPGPTCKAELPEKGKFHLFLLVGQSNMAGRGIVTEADRQPHPRVLMMDRQLKWVPAVDPMHFDKPRVVGVGLGRTFGIRVAEADPKIVVGLIPCAAGGSPIESWEPGGFHAQTNSHPYDETLARAEAALKVGVLKGILWHQGEADSRPERAPLYEQKLHEFIARIRRELDAPTVPFVAGQMGIFEEAPWNEHKKIVDAAHRELPAKVPHTAFVSAHELTAKPDLIHFDAKSYRIMGTRYAQAFRNLQSTDGVVPVPVPIVPDATR